MYYKGVLAKSKCFSIQPNIILGTRNNKNEFNLNMNIEGQEEKNLLKSYLFKSVEKYNVTRTDIVSLFDKYIPKTTVETDDMYEEIIYEVYKDKNGSLFGKELHTGLYFPLNLVSNVAVDYSVITEKNDIEDTYVLSVKLTFAPSSMKKSLITIGNIASATDEEVKAYLKKYKKSFFNSRNHKRFIEFLEVLSKNNQFENQASETFTKVDTIPEEEKKNNIVPPVDNKKKENEIVLPEEYQVDFLEYVENLRYSAINDFLNDNANLKLNEIDEVVSSFLRYSEIYSSLEQVKLFQDISYVYLLYAYQHKEELTKEMLEKSYFQDILNAILNKFNDLKSEKIIKVTRMANTSSEINSEYVLNLIKASEIDKEKLKELEYSYSK